MTILGLGSKVLPLSRHRSQRLAERLIDDLFLFARRSVGDEVLARAFDIFWGGGDDLPLAEDEGSMGRFFDWLVFDYRPGGRGRTVLERYVARSGKGGGEETEILRLWCRSRLGVYEVLARSDGGDLLLEDVCTGARHRCWDRLAARNLHRFDLVLTRLLPVGGETGLSVAGLVLPRWWKASVVRCLGEGLARFRTRRPAAGWEEYFRSRGHEIHRILLGGLRAVGTPRFHTLSGEACVVSRAWYRVGDPAAVAPALARQPCLEAAADGVWRWFAPPEENPPGGRLVLGVLVLRGSRLRLECLSLERLERGKGLLLAWLDGCAEHVLDEFESVTVALPNLPGERRRDRGEEGGLSLTPARWVDEPAPVLGGLTPRQASQTRDGRARLRELLRVIENLEEKKKRAGHPYVDVEAIRRQLNLSEEW